MLLSDKLLSFIFCFMNAKKILFLLFGILILSCEKDTKPAVELSQTDFNNVSYEKTALEVEIKTDLEWTATSRVDWCKVSQSKGSGSAKIMLNVEPNIENDRTGAIVIWTPEKTIQINLQQTALPAGQEFNYKIPVVFHVLYSDKGDDKQYVPQERLAEILGNVNLLYNGETSYNGGDAGVDMNLEFVLAEENEAGEKLTTPGVDYVKVDQMPIDCEAFMSDSRYVKMLWDPNEYVNIMIYNFAAVDGGSSVILGISHLPLSVDGGTYLEGLPKTTYSYLTKDNLSYPKCVSINSLYIYEDMGSNGQYNSMNVNVTLAHELGHYLGLHHAFDENDDSSLSTKCIDSDYCEDTPSYNRQAYVLNLRALLSEAKQAGKTLSMADAVERENCKTGETFSSYNLMDYEISYSDRFTDDQRMRIRHVLTYSPLTPGPKKGVTSTKGVSGPLDLPMVIVK